MVVSICPQVIEMKIVEKRRKKGVMNVVHRPYYYY
jgi:hypothetical protein